MRLCLGAFLWGATLLVGMPGAATAAETRAPTMTDQPMILVGAANMQPTGNSEAGTFVLERKALPAFADTGSSDYVRLMNSEGAKPRGRISGILLMAVPGPILGASVPVLLGLAGLLFARTRRRRDGATVRSRL